MEASGGLQQGHRGRLGAARVHAGEIGSTHFGVARTPPSVIPAPLTVIPAPPPSFLRPLRHSCAGRNPGELGGFENGADAGRPPVGPSARSDGLVARPRDGGVGRPAAGASGQARCSPCPCRRDRFDTLRGCAHAPLRHSCAPLGDSRAPSVIPAPPPSFLRRQESRRAAWVRERRRCWTASRRSERPLGRPGGPSAGWKRRADLGGRLDSCLRRNDGRGRTG